jgi:hypothetical protein
MRQLVICAVFGVLGLGCAPALGDACKTRTDCSVNNDRYCDTSQPGGYCTIVNCAPGSCGDEGYCVRFKPDEPRLSSDWCMAKCSDDGDCRDAYVCRSAKQLNERDKDDDVDEPRIAEMLDKKTNGKFCVAKD